MANDDGGGGWVVVAYQPSVKRIKFPAKKLKMEN